MRLNIPYGEGSIGFSVSDERLLGVLQNKADKGKNVRKLLIKALRNKDVPFRKKKVLVAVADSTRNSHLKEILPVLLETIDNPSRKIDIIIATGLHKKHTPEQVTRLLGPVIPKRYKVLHHDPSASGVVDLGQTPYGVPVTIDKAVTGYDMIISVGVVEPHLYAGYSGGAKTVAIGLAGIDTVNATHSIDFLKKPSTCIGSLKGNRFQETLWHIVERLPPIFSVNTVNSQDGDALKIFCGPVKDVFEKSVAFAKDVYEVTTGEACDIAICGIGYPKDINLYQASRAMNYVLSVDSPVVRSAGALIIAAELKDGIGGSPAEKRFHDELKNMSSPQDFIEHISRAGCVAGEHRAYMVARALAGHRIMFVNKRKEDFMDGLPFKFYTSIDDALKAAEELTGKDAKICVIPHSLATIPRLV